MHDFSSISSPPAGAYEAEFETEYENEFETAEFENELEANEYELATQLLGVTNEMEMEQFLGDVFKTIGHAAKSVINSPVGKALGGVLKTAAKTALPMVGSALGNMVLPGIGGALGGQLAGMAGGALGLELEGLSHEDRELEVAQKLVRVARQAANNLVFTPVTVAPEHAARAAFAHAVRQTAPEVLRIPEVMRVVRQAAAGVPATAPVLPVARSIAATIPTGGEHLPPHHPHHPNNLRRAIASGAVPTYGNTVGAYNAAAPTYGTVAQSYGGATPTYGATGGVPARGPHQAHPGVAQRGTCGSCGGSGLLPQHGSWRMSRSGRAIVLFIDGR